MSEKNHNLLSWFMALSMFIFIGLLLVLSNILGDSYPILINIVSCLCIISIPTTIVGLVWVIRNIRRKHEGVVTVSEIFPKQKNTYLRRLSLACARVDVIIIILLLIGVFFYGNILMGPYYGFIMFTLFFVIPGLFFPLAIFLRAKTKKIKWLFLLWLLNVLLIALFLLLASMQIKIVNLIWIIVIFHPMDVNIRLRLEKKSNAKNSSEKK